MGEWRCSFIILDVGTGWRWVVSFTSLPLYPPGESPRTHCIGGWAGPRAGLKAVEKRNVDWVTITICKTYSLLNSYFNFSYDNVVFIKAIISN
jgi:hypothetical protein